jgi:hypothetical protein
MTSATVNNTRMRLIMRYLLMVVGNPLVGCSVLYKEDYGALFGLRHCQNYLFLLWGVPNLWFCTLT